MEVSLALIEPQEVTFSLQHPYEGKSASRPRVSFSLNGRRYNLALTDYSVRPRLMDAGFGDYEPGELGLDAGSKILLTVSLAEPREGWCTKLVAAVMFMSDP